MIVPSGVYGVGVGPGDPSLVTLRAASILGAADLVIAPKARDGAESVALSIAREHLSEPCEVFEAVFPMNDDAQARLVAARGAAERLADVARRGGVAVLITLGDPMTYSTWGYTLRELQDDHPDIPVETVPGITSYSAAAAKLGRPLAEGDEPLLIVPGTGGLGLERALEVADNVVVLKAGRSLGRLAEEARSVGADLGVARRLGHADEAVSTDAAGIPVGTDYLTLAIAHRDAGVPEVGMVADPPPIDFVGAGPGDPELVTVAGMRALQSADLVLWAGSLVPEEVLDWTSPDCEVVDSAGLALDAQIDVMAEAWRAGKRVVRLHTGDPSLFGATAEQWELLDAASVPYRVVPGVSSFLASAAALPAELTLPEVSQTVIIARAAGRTPVPEGQDLASLAAHRATMAIFLSAGHAETVAGQLLEHYPQETPAAIIQRASWPEQRVERCTVGTLASTFAETGIDRTAMILVGDSLAGANGRRSHLYDRSFAHGYREGEGER